MRQTRAARIRRRRLATTLAAVSLSVAGVLTVRGPNGSGVSGVTDPVPTPSATPVVADRPAPSARSLIRDYVATRDGAVSVAVYDEVSHKRLVVHRHFRGWTGSMVKADILEALLHRTHGRLSNSERSLATAMIEHSDNHAATDLYWIAGGPTGVAAYNHAIGMKHTQPTPNWGISITTSWDQVQLMRVLVHPTHLLTARARHFQRHLMRNLENDQRWGISGGVPNGVDVGNKNGWSPMKVDHDRWIVASVGWVHGQGRRYEIAVLSKHVVSEAYGVHTIEHIAGVVWRHAAVRSASASTGPG